jgi:hypothetical protein
VTLFVTTYKERAVMTDALENLEVNAWSEPDEIDRLMRIDDIPPIKVPKLPFPVA